MESEVHAAKLQLKELQSLYQCAVDANLAMQVFSLQQVWDEQHGAHGCNEIVSSSSLPANDWELRQLQDQIDSLTNFIISCEDQKAASGLQSQEAANTAAYDASLELAECIAAQESWDKRICDHDAAFARMLSRCDSVEWEERGELLESPLRLPPRPRTPVVTNGPMFTSGVCIVLDTPASGHMSGNSVNSSDCTAGLQSSASSSSSGRPPICLGSGTAVVSSSSSSTTSRPGRDTSAVSTGVAVANSSSITSSRSWRQDVAGSQIQLQSGVAIVVPDCGYSSRPHAAADMPATAQSGIITSTTSTSCSTQPNSTKGKQPMQPPLAHHSSRTNSSSSSSSTTFPTDHDSISSSKGSQAQSQCGICFDSFATSKMVSALLPQEQASSSAVHGRCGHYFCQGCMRSFVKEELKARHYPVCCPMPACQEELGHNDILQLLSGSTKDLQVYDMLVMENSIDASLRVYCPYKDCSCLLERPDDGGADEPFECPSCHRVFCGNCGIAGWHMGMTCQQFQALPPELRSVEDAAMLRMAAAQSWKRCPAPGCGHVVERTEGCNHMRCRCGVDFCYACGKQYRSSEPTADNVHGTPGCECPLFAVPEEVEERFVPAPPPALVLRPARPRPWRGGRMVSRTRCWHSSSIHDCPQGPQRCWFWHDEDNDY